MKKQPTDHPRAAEARRDFLTFLLGAGALQFGSFTLKSGRVSPYFLDTGRFRTGPQIERLGGFYAQAIEGCAPAADVVFGPAYKGIALCIAAAIALSRRQGREVGFLFNRKEEKTHGERGRFVGRVPAPGERLVLVDDVITDGGTKREAVAMLREAFEARIEALVIAFNRMERDHQGGDALRQFESLTGIPVVSLFSLADLERALAAKPGHPGLSGVVHPRHARVLAERIRAYRERYGVAGHS